MAGDAALEDVKAVARSYFEQLTNKQDVGFVDTLFTDDIAFYDPAIVPDGEAHGHAEVKQFFSVFFKVFPDVHFAIDDFFAEEARRYGLGQSDPVDVFVAPAVASIPPQPPDGASIPEVMLWSLQLRFWAWRHGDIDGPAPHVSVFVLYHDPALVQRVPHSLGLQKGLLGVVYAFASEEQSGPNNLVIAHELLHTLGAVQRYDPATNLPVHPDGYAEPDRDPLWPQELAEIMAGRIPLSAQRAEMPEGLAQALIGEATAREIRWLQ